MNPDRTREHNAQRRARKRNAPRVEVVDRAAIWERDGGKCHLCHKPCDPKDWHLDHVMPLSRGGEHAPENVAVAHPVCNMRRYNSGPAQLRLMG